MNITKIERKLVQRGYSEMSVQNILNSSTFTAILKYNGQLDAYIIVEQDDHIYIGKIVDMFRVQKWL